MYTRPSLSPTSSTTTTAGCTTRASACASRRSRAVELACVGACTAIGAHELERDLAAEHARRCPGSTTPSPPRPSRPSDAVAADLRRAARRSTARSPPRARAGCRRSRRSVSRSRTPTPSASPPARSWLRHEAALSASSRMRSFTRWNRLRARWLARASSSAIGRFVVAHDPCDVVPVELAIDHAAAAAGDRRAAARRGARRKRSLIVDCWCSAVVLRTCSAISSTCGTAESGDRACGVADGHAAPVPRRPAPPDTTRSARCIPSAIRAASATAPRRTARTHRPHRGRARTTHVRARGSPGRSGGSSASRSPRQLSALQAARSSPSIPASSAMGRGS